MKGEAATFLLAVQFLTRLPAPVGTGYTPERMAASVKYYPLVGALVGLVCAQAYWAASLALPHALAAVAAIAVGLLITGAFHEDGLADVFDGVGGGASRERALQIMKDSRLGTYGVAALVVALALKAGALAALPAEMMAASLVAGHGLSRLSSVAAIATSRYAREEGTAKPVAVGVSRAAMAVALATGAAIMAGWALVRPPAALGCALAGLAAGHVLMRLFYERKLGGYTGDALGAVQQASEIGFYLGLAAWA